MATRIKQYEPYDGPDAKNLPAILPGESDYLQIKNPDEATKVTSNESCHRVWSVINAQAQRVSAQSYSIQPMVTADLMTDVLFAIDICFATIRDVLVSRAGNLFSSTFGGPPTYGYQAWPVRWPSENLVTFRAVMRFVEAGFQVPQVRSNSLDRGIVEDHAVIITQPLFTLKATLMAEFFGIEPRGAISPDELQSLFRNSKLRPPLRFSMTDTADTTEETAIEDAVALTDETVPRPTQAQVEQAQAGIDVWSWQPGSDDLITMAEKLRRLERDGPGHSPGQPWPFTVGPVGGPVGGPGA